MAVFIARQRLWYLLLAVKGEHSVFIRWLEANNSYLIFSAAK